MNFFSLLSPLHDFFFSWHFRLHEFFFWFFPHPPASGGEPQIGEVTRLDGLKK